MRAQATRPGSAGAALATLHEDPMAGRPLTWERDGRDWPLRATSRFVAAGGVRWHVQVSGHGPAALLVHGTGAASHSWRGLAPLLARDFTVIAPDLPGHGFTPALPAAGMSLPGMAAGLQALLLALGEQPVLGVGHSAGAAILARLCLDGAMPLRALVSLNGAIVPLAGWPGLVFSPAARLLARNPLVPRLFAWRAAEPAAVRRLITGTGSRLDAHGEALYGRLMRSPDHVAGALAMMANWDLEPLSRDLPRLAAALLLLVGGGDRTLPPSEAARVRAMLPAAHQVTLPGLGHLAHEEDPAQVAALITTFAAANP
jgi:magnesium chelatase accessory protein